MKFIFNIIERISFSNSSLFALINKSKYLKKVFVVIIDPKLLNINKIIGVYIIDFQKGGFNLYKLFNSILIDNYKT